MADKALDKIPPGPELDALTAEKVFGWKNVHKHDGELIGKKQEKPGVGGRQKCLAIQLTLLRYTQLMNA